MYTVVGLGNPGEEYTHTRHNTGRMLVSKFAEKNDIALTEKKKPAVLVGSGTAHGEKVRVVVPNTFMNVSGKAVAPYIKSVPAAKKLIVVYDDIDLPLGKVRLSFGSGAAGHNGVKSIERAVKTKNFIKMRVGVSKTVRGKVKKPVGEKAVVEYLLHNFTKGDLEKVQGPVQERVFMALETILETHDPVKGMNAVNGLPA